MTHSVTTAVHFGQRKARGKGAEDGSNTCSKGRVPRISRLMALAIHMNRLVREGVVADYAELARLGHVSRARITQIMNLNCLAPDVQEEVLFLPRVMSGRDPIRDHAVREIATVLEWKKQRRLWRELRGSSGGLGGVAGGGQASVALNGDSSRS